MTEREPTEETETVTGTIEDLGDILVIPLAALPAGSTVTISIHIGPVPSEPTEAPPPTRRYLGQR